MISRIVHSLVQKNLDEKAFSACAVSIQKFGQSPEFLCLGNTSIPQGAKSIDRHSLFDLSSLTKVIFTTTWVAKLVQNTNLPLKISISKLRQFSNAVPHIKNASYLDVTLEDLLLHRAGFPAVAPYDGICHGNSSQEIIQCISSVAPEYSRGEKTLYSDLGFIFLAEILSIYTGKSVEEAWAIDVQKPLDLSCTKTTYQLENTDVVVQSCPGDEARLIYDPAVRYLDRLCGHAGLWGSITDIMSFGDIWLYGYYEGHSNLRNNTAKAFVDPYLGKERRLGWDGISENSTAGEITKTAIGHLGYTGTSLWIDLEKKVVVGLLTNRTHTQLKNVNDLIDQKQKKDFNEFRRSIHNELWRTISS